MAKPSRRAAAKRAPIKSVKPTPRKDSDANSAITNAAIADRRRADGWSNISTGLGTIARDARMKAEVVWRRMTEYDIEHLYAGDAMAAKIVDLPVDDALNKGYKWTGISPEQEKTLKARLKELYFDDSIREAAQKARLYGGACILKVYNDDLILDKQVNPDSKPPLKSLVVFQRFEIPAYWQDVQQDMLSTEFGCPIYYTFIGRSTGAAFTNVKIHYSRLVRFAGTWLPDRIREANQYWDDTCLSKLYDAVRNYATGHDSLNAAIKDLSVAVFKMKGLAENLAADDDETVIQRVSIVNLTKSIARAVVLDSESEEFDYKARTLTGADDLLDKAESRLAAETSIPRTKLFGESPQGGMGQSGDHQSEQWYDYVESYQIHKLKPNMLEVAKEVAEELGINTDKLDIEFNPLWQMSAKEEAETRLKTAESDVKYIDAGVVNPSEIRTSRFGGDKYTPETTLDESITPEQMDEEAAKVKAEEAAKAEAALKNNNPGKKEPKK